MAAAYLKGILLYHFLYGVSYFTMLCRVFDAWGNYFGKAHSCNPMVTLSNISAVHCIIDTIDK